MQKIALVAILLLIAVYAFTSKLQAQTTFLNNETASCALKPTLPPIFYSAFECGPCCQSAQTALQRCMFNKGYPKNPCDCVQQALDTCLNGGCGPCQCCADYITLGQQAGCGGRKAAKK